VDHPDDEEPASAAPDAQQQAFAAPRDPIAPPAQAAGAAAPSRPLRVFLCQSSGDKPAVRALYGRLRAEGIDPWLDEECLLPGQDWQQEIPKAVRAADSVLVCLSRAAITKAGYVQKEIRYALDVADEQPEGAIFIVPIKLEECAVPERLRRWHWVDLFAERGYERLMRGLRERAQAVGATATTLIEPRLKGIRILLVEDEPDLARDIADLLGAYSGAIVEVAASVAQAQALLNRRPVPDLVLTNHQLRGMATGADLARWMYAEPYLQRTLRVSFSSEQPRLIQRGSPPGLFHAMIAKTAPLIELVAQLGDLIQRRGALTEEENQ
jgi:CheY-like chemotaxis protein